MKTLSLLAVVMLACVNAQAADSKSVARGRYLVQIAGCNDCHTAGYPQSGGKIPEAQWLLGNPVGFSGPWGTTYPSNLRRYFANVSDKAFIADARSGRMRPPMPWFALRDMTNADLRAIRSYVRSLGAPGADAPAYVPPGQAPNTPHIVFVPQPPNARQARAH